MRKQQKFKLSCWLFLAMLLIQYCMWTASYGKYTPNDDSNWDLAITASSIMLLITFLFFFCMLIRRGREALDRMDDMEDEYDHDYH